MHNHNRPAQSRHRWRIVLRPSNHRTARLHHRRSRRLARPLVEGASERRHTIDPISILITAGIVLIGSAVYDKTQKTADDVAAHAAKSVLEKPIITLTPTHVIAAAAAYWWSRKNNGR